MHASSRPTPMPSKFKVPERRKQVAARLPETLVRKLEAAVRIWKIQAVAQGKATEEVDDITQTWVIEVLLGHALDTELSQFGGLPQDEDGWKAVEKTIRLANKQ